MATLIGLLVGAVMYASVFVVLISLGIMSHGFVIFNLWKWFAVPIFGVEPLTFIHAVAVSILIGALKIKVTKENIAKQSAEEALRVMAWTIIYMPVIYLGLGFILKRFI